MTKKKISAKEFNYIWEPMESERQLDWSKTYTMAKFDNGGYCFVKTIKTWLFILSFLPVTAIIFFNCLWDGGLRTFKFPRARIHVRRLDIQDKTRTIEYFNRADEIWKKA